MVEPFVKVRVYNVFRMIAISYTLFFAKLAINVDISRNRVFLTTNAHKSPTTNSHKPLIFVNFPCYDPTTNSRKS